MSPVFVQVNAGGQAFTVLAPRARRAPAEHLVECAAACGFWIRPGSYEVRVHGEQHETSVTLRVHGPGNYDFVPENRASRRAGLVLGIVGPVVTAVGAVMVLVGAYNGCDTTEIQHSCSTPPISYYGAATFVAGAGMTAVGWSLYIYNRPHFTLSNAPSAWLGWRPTSARLGLVPMPRGGLGLGATVSF